MTTSFSTNVSSMLLATSVWVGYMLPDHARTGIEFFLDPNCVPSSRTGAERARALSQVELQGLYSIIKQHSGERVMWGRGFKPLPDEFARARVLYGDVGFNDRLVFGGCMDDKAALMFDGVDGVGPRQIRLTPGEHEPTEVLWRDAVQKTK